MFFAICFSTLLISFSLRFLLPFFLFLEEHPNRDEPVTPMSASSMGENAAPDIKPPVPEPIQGGGAPSGTEKKKKCC